jgi:hypothetical protein
VDAAVVELDALADPVRAAAEDHDLPALRRLGLALLVVGRVHVRGLRRELGGAGVDALVDRAHTVRVAVRAHGGFGCPEQRRQALVRKALALQVTHLGGAEVVEGAPPDGFLASEDLPIWARNQGSIPVSSWISSALMPMRKASPT